MIGPACGFCGDTDGAEDLSGIVNNSRLDVGSAKIKAEEESGW